MNEVDANAFAHLFAEAAQKCFGYALTAPLSETESKQMSNQVLGQTGLIVGWKSLKNYSFFVMNPAGKQQNPSVATMDTLARYVLNAPYTDEVKRKDHESHFPYWFQYKNQFHQAAPEAKTNTKIWIWIAAVLALVAVVILVNYFSKPKNEPKVFVEDFHSVVTDSLRQHGWHIQDEDAEYWSKRDENVGYLTLFTLKGDNWPDTTVAPVIKNFLFQEINSDCFSVEVQLADFFPRQNWQQAGLLLLEDTSFTGRAVRITFSYNDFFGGYTRDPEIIIQAITSQGGQFGKPEEIAHVPVFRVEPGQEALIENNLKSTALRIEKQGRKLRFLYANGPTEIFAFKEAVTQEFDIDPKYVGIFALKGFVQETENLPVKVKSFRFTSSRCKE